MSTTILRVEKVKSMANVRQSGAHQFRHHVDTPNADPERKSLNHTFVGSGNLGRDVQSRLDTLTKAPRKNAVLAIDGLVTLSPELFKTKGNLVKWGNQTHKWLKEQFGENLVSAVVHRDESNPHMHFTVVPVDEKADGRRVLNARDMFDKWQLSDMQRSYNEAMRGCIENVQAPKHGSKARHTTISQFYDVLNNEQDELVSDIVSSLRQRLEGEVEGRFESLLGGLDAYVLERMSKTSDDMQEQLRSFYKGLRDEAVKLRELDMAKVQESVEGAFESIGDDDVAEITKVVNESIAKRVSKAKPAGMRL